MTYVTYEIGGTTACKCGLRRKSKDTFRFLVFLSVFSETSKMTPLGKLDLKPIFDFLHARSVTNIFKHWYRLNTEL